MRPSRLSVQLGALVGSFLSLTVFHGASIAQSVPATVEDVVQESDLIVLGRVTETDSDGVRLGDSWQMLFTRHSFEVETYYRGSGPKVISLFTPGGFETRLENGKERRTLTQVTGSVGVRKGEEFLAFLRSAPGGYVFAEWDGAKYPIYATQVDSQTERVVNIRLRKKQYMQGMALKGFVNLERLETGPNPAAKVEEKLRGTKGIEEVVLVQELSTKVAAIIRGEGATRE